MDVAQAKPTGTAWHGFVTQLLVPYLVRPILVCQYGNVLQDLLLYQIYGYGEHESIGISGKKQLHAELLLHTPQQHMRKTTPREVWQ